MICVTAIAFTMTIFIKEDLRRLSYGKEKVDAEYSDQLVSSDIIRRTSFSEKEDAFQKLDNTHQL